jgi:putative transposase
MGYKPDHYLDSLTQQTKEVWMDKDTREQIALIRYKIISPVLAEPARLQNEYFRGQARKEHMFPHYGLRQVSVSTMKSWLTTFKKKGFYGLYPKARWA